MGDQKRGTKGFVCTGELLESSITDVFADRKALEAHFFNFKKRFLDYFLCLPLQTQFSTDLPDSEKGGFAAESIVET